MTFITPILYATGGTLAAVIAASTYFSYARSRNKAQLYLFISFLFLALHSFALSVPAFMDAENLRLVGRGYVVGMIFLFMLLIAAFQVQGSINPEFSRKHGFIVHIVLLGIGIAVVSILLSDFRLPSFSPRGVIFWNASPLAAWLAGVTSLVYGLVWADFFQQARLRVSGYAAKTKLFMLSVDGVLLGVAGLLVFTSSNEWESIAGHVLFVAACLLTLFIFLIEKKR